MKQQIIKIIESHRPPMVHPTNRSGGEYLVACEVDRILDEVIKDVENVAKERKELKEAIVFLILIPIQVIISYLGVFLNSLFLVIIPYILMALWFLNKNISNKTSDKFKCKDCGHTLVRTRGQGMYCGICKN